MATTALSGQYPPIWVHAYLDETESVQRILKTTPDVIELRGGNAHSTPLGVAVLNGNIALVTILLDAGANPSSADLEGTSDSNPVAKASRQNDLEILSLLLEYGGEVSTATIINAASYNRYDVMGLLLGSGADVESRNRRGRTPLHIASLGDNRNLFHVLVGYDADVHAEADNGATPLHYAAHKDNAILVQNLLRLGASVSARTNGLGSAVAPISNGATPLHYAAMGGGENALILLLDQGGDDKAVDSRGETLLHYAAKKGRAAIVRLLIEREVDLEPKAIPRAGEQDLTPARMAIINGHFGIAVLLQTAIVLREEIRERKREAFAMGHHKRLGEASRIYGLDDLALQLILEKVPV